MKSNTKQSLLYITIVAVIYVLIGILEFFIGPYILDVVVDNRWIQLIIFLICLISINIILTAFIASKVPYKVEGLKKLEKPKELRKRPAEEILNKEVTESSTNKKKKRLFKNKDRKQKSNHQRNTKKSHKIGI